MKHKLLGALIAIASILISCSRVEESVIEGMFPDYSDVSIPYNIAPLNFRINGAGSIKVTVRGKEKEYVFHGRKGLVKFPLKRWHSMLEAEKGGKLDVSVSARGRKGDDFSAISLRMVALERLRSVYFEIVLEPTGSPVSR